MDASAPAVTILKPLHGDEAGLFENLVVVLRTGLPRARFRSCSASRTRTIRRSPWSSGCAPRIPARRSSSSIDTARHGLQSEGRKPHQHERTHRARHRRAGRQRHPRAARLSVAPRRARSSASAARVTCPYYGISTGSLWSRLAQLTIDSHFLPGRRGRRAARSLSRPCLGSTIALRRQSLVAIGGFEPLADCLADDYVLGELLRERGEPVTVLPFAVGHVCGESSVRRIVAARAALGADHPHHRSAGLSRLDRDARLPAGADRLGGGRRLARDWRSVWRPWPAGPS